MSDGKNGRDNLKERLTQSQDERNANILRAWLPTWVTNSHVNHGLIVEEFQHEDRSLLNLPRPEEGNGPCVICGSGPSLNRTAPMLADWKGAVFCAGSNAKIATRYGHQPEFVVVFDANENVHDQLKGWDWKGSVLLTNPACSPSLLRWWRWRKRYYLMLHPQAEGQKLAADLYGSVRSFEDEVEVGDVKRLTEREEFLKMIARVKPLSLGSWFTEIQPLAYCANPQYQRLNLKPPDIRVAILNAGCTVVNAIQIAKFLKYDPIFLIGVDFGYPNGVHRATGWEYEAGQWVEQPGVPDDWMEKCERPIHIADNGVPTTEEQIDYKIALMAVWNLDKPRLYDCSEGILTELPKADFAEVVERQGQGYDDYLTPEEVTKVARETVEKISGTRETAEVAGG